MTRISTVIIGAGHCGLAMSRRLSQRNVDHVVLERGRVANSWRTERWDSLRLLTPNWQSTLPGDPYDGPAPDGFMTMPELIFRLERYAQRGGAPVQTQTEVLAVHAEASGYRVETTRGVFHCANVVLASGACNIANAPAVAAEVPWSVQTFTPMSYKRPADLPNKGVLVVGASASGVQIAREVHASGRPVTLAVGEHVRVPRSYRGRDIQRWMQRLGLLDQRWDAVDDLNRVRRTPSLQLAGGGLWRTLDLNALTDDGVRIVGRLVGVRAGKAQFSGSLANMCAAADLKMNRLLDAIDAHVEETVLQHVVGPQRRLAPTRVPSDPLLELDFGGEAIGSVIWATGYRPDYSLLHLPVTDRKGRLRHDGGVLDAPGLYAMGLPFMRKRKSTLITGAGDDAAALAEHLVARSARRLAA
ncbi:MAG: NAD(P)-binding domain-containing protein [Pseudomonadota bacterium]